MSTIISGPLALRGAQAAGWVEIDGAVVAGSGHGPPPRAPDQETEDLLSAGLIDLQVNGAGGREVWETDALAPIEETLLRRGVTGWLPTVISTDERTAADALPRIGACVTDPDSTVLGAHLEGPFLAPDHRGVHRAEMLRSPADGVPSYIRDPAVRLVTLAPELPEAIELVTELVAAGVVVSLGHSGADAATARRAVDAGATMVTHVFNAMAPLHHRAPGLAGVALTDEQLTVGVIADGVHIDPLVLGLIERLAGPRVALVSDASPAAAGEATTFAGVPLDADGRAAGRPAGSLCLLDEDVLTWASATGCGRAAALHCAADVPAAALGLAARLSPGSPADLVEWDSAGRARRVMVAGRWRAVT